MTDTNPFYTSPICASRLHCEACRSGERQGRTFRRDVDRLYGTGQSFPCPFGVAGGELAEPQPLTVKGVLHGAAGLAKVALGLGIAPRAEVDRRRGICGGCEHRRPGPVGDYCSACGCVVAAKTTLATERCPLDPPRWGPATGSE